jgi:hypothetical protein
VNSPLRRIVAGLALGAIVVASASALPAQRGGRNRGGGGLGYVDRNWVYDGRFVFCRLAFNQSFDGDGGGWSVDYPRADINFPFRLGELTEAPISHDENGVPNHVVITLTDPHLFNCPFVMMTEPGGAGFSQEEATKLREYLDKGGFLWADDFWGEYAFSVWEREIRKALPADEFPIRDLPMSHPIFSMSYALDAVPQIPSINFWLGNGGATSERGFDSKDVHARGIENANGDVMVFMTHNTDLGDAFEREGADRGYFEAFASKGYALGVNVFLYAMTH